MPNFAKLQPFKEDGDLNMVVETPRGSSVKLRYDPKARVFTVSRAVTLGLSYPFDWGFIPGTEAEDGDPVDALALHDNRTFSPGCCWLSRTRRRQHQPKKEKRQDAKSVADPDADLAWMNGRAREVDGACQENARGDRSVLRERHFFTGKGSKDRRVARSQSCACGRKVREARWLVPSCHRRALRFLSRGPVMGRSATHRVRADPS
jgi:Inorganic pyrophosphatase